MSGEARLFERLRAALLGKHERFERVENGLVEGMPDVNYCFSNGAEGWIELKAPLEPKRASTALFGSNHEVSISQTNWFHRQFMAGGRGWLLIGTDKRFILIEGGRVAAASWTINKKTIAQLEAMSQWAEKKPVRDAVVWADLKYVLRR